MLNSIAFKVRKFTYKRGEKVIHPLKILRNWESWKYILTLSFSFAHLNSDDSTSLDQGGECYFEDSKSVKGYKF